MTAIVDAPIRKAADAADLAARRAHAGSVSTPVALRRGRLATWVATACAAAFAALFGLIRAKRSEALDLAITLRLQRRAHPRLDAVMTAASWPGFPPQSRVIPPTLIGSLWLLRFRPEAALQTAAWGSALLSTGLKALMRRPRPVAGTDLRVVAAPLGGTSFPSGHVLTYVGTYGTTAYLAATLLRDQPVRLPIVAGLLTLIAVVGPSRIYQGHHWPTDVTASYLLGTTYVIVLTTAYRRVKAARLSGGIAARAG